MEGALRRMESQQLGSQQVVRSIEIDGPEGRASDVSLSCRCFRVRSGLPVAGETGHFFVYGASIVWSLLTPKNPILRRHNIGGLSNAIFGLSTLSFFNPQLWMDVEAPARVLRHGHSQSPGTHPSSRT